jgi:hypothetical protein
MLRSAGSAGATNQKVKGNGMSNNNFELQQERDRLQAEVNRLQVSRDSGVPVGVLGDAATVEEAQARADVALAWKAATSPQAAPPSAPQQQYLPNQINRQTLPYMTAQEISEAHRRGQFEALGAPAPAPRKTGERNSRTI